MGTNGNYTSTNIIQVKDKIRQIFHSLLMLKDHFSIQVEQTRAQVVANTRAVYVHLLCFLSNMGAFLRFHKLQATKY